jgi:hypothetical protein
MPRQPLPEEDGPLPPYELSEIPGAHLSVTAADECQDALSCMLKALEAALPHEKELGDLMAPQGVPIKEQETGKAKPDPFPSIVLPTREEVERFSTS